MPTDRDHEASIAQRFAVALLLVFLGTALAILTTGRQWQRENARDGQEPFMSAPPAALLTAGCDLDTLRANLATLSPGELAAVGYVGDDGNWHALTAAALKGQ